MVKDASFAPVKVAADGLTMLLQVFPSILR